MEQNFEPFEVVEEDGRTILTLHGTEEQRAKVEADKVHLLMDAIAQVWDIDIKFYESAVQGLSKQYQTDLRHGS